jgi:hypothetical protein
MRYLAQVGRFPEAAEFRAKAVGLGATEESVWHQLTML